MTKFLRIVLFGAMLTAALFIGVASFAADAENPYVVEDVAVSVSGKSPTDGRNQAVKSGRRDAFAILATRLDLDLKALRKISDDDISDMVRSEQINDEKIAGNNYSATMSVTFAKDFVDHILAQKNLLKEDAKEAEGVENKGAALIVPVTILPRKILIWEGSNSWRSAIGKAVDGDDAFKIPAGDSENVMTLNPENINHISAQDLEPFLSKYKTDVVYFVFFSRDNVANKASVKIRPLGKTEVLQTKLNFTNAEGLDEQELLIKVAGKTIDYLKSIKNDELKKTEQNFSLEIPVSRLGDWLMIKNKIETSGFVNRLSIDAISCDYVKASIVVSSTNTNAAELFSKIGFYLTQKSSDVYLLTTNPVQ